MKTTTTKNKKRTLANAKPSDKTKPSEPVLSGASPRKSFMMRKFLLKLLLAAFLLPSFVHADEIIIGEGSYAQFFYPFHNISKYSRTESLYPKTAFSSACTINSLSFRSATSNPLVFNELKIYMGERSRGYFESATDWTPEDDLTLVYSGSNITLGDTPGWHELVLETPFPYEHEGDLVIVVSKNLAQGGYWSRWYFSSTSPNVTTLQWFSSEDNNVMDFPTTAATTIHEYRADIKINITPYTLICHKPVEIEVSHTSGTEISITWTPYEGTSAWDVYIGDTPTASTTPTASGLTSPSYTFTGLNSATAYKCHVRTRCGEGEVSTWKRISVMTEPDFIGEGTESCPYLLYSKSDMEALNTAIGNGWSTYGKHFKVMRDIATLTEPLQGTFRGDFDGDGHTLSLDMHTETGDHQALFVAIGPGARIHDVTVRGYITGSLLSGFCTAGIVAFIATDGMTDTDDMFISNCINKVEITTSGISESIIGGIVGKYSGDNSENGSHLHIIGCKNMGKILGVSGCRGGIAGHFCNFGVINGCENLAEITGNGRCGGIVGFSNNYSRIMNCLNKGEITGEMAPFRNAVGGIIGQLMNDSQIINCYNLGKIEMAGGDGELYLGGIAGRIDDRAQTRNVYNAGQIIPPQYHSAGAIIDFVGSEVIIDGTYYEENSYITSFGVIWGDDIQTTNCSSFTQDTVDPTICTLDTMCYNSTDLRTALNNWRNGNTDYNEWLTDIYGYNNYFPTFTVGNPPGLEITPNPLVMGPRPIGANMHGERFTLTNTGMAGIDINSLDIAGSPFFVLDSQAGNPETPFHLDGEESISISVTTRPDAAVVPGETTASLVALWSERNVSLAEMTATAYLPEIPDLVETPLPVDSFPFTATQNTTLIYDNYLLPGSHADGPDGVYKLTFDHEMVLNASVSEGNQPKIALYAEDLGGKPYPDTDNCYTGPPIGQGVVAPISEWLSYDDGIYVTSLGSTNGPMYWGVMFPVASLAAFEGCSLTKVQIYDADSPGTATLNIYKGGYTAPETQLVSQAFTLSGSNSWTTVELDQPFPLDATRNLWICLYSESPYPATACEYVGEPNSCWVSQNNTSWNHLTNFGLNYSWMIRGFATNLQTGSENFIEPFAGGMSSGPFLTKGPEAPVVTQPFGTVNPDRSYPVSFGGDQAITNLTVTPGTYYLVASSTSPQYILDINPTEIPAPLPPQVVSPADGASEVLSPVTLQWALGTFTTEYQLLLGTVYPPTEVVVEWTGDLAESYRAGFLSNNTTYFWQVNERNSAGTTYGPVWGFTSALNIPQNLTAFNDKLFEGDTLALSWTPVNDRSHRGYNLYRDGVKINENPITGTSCTVEGLTYNMGGYRFNVTALYDEGESRYSNAVLVRVSGSGSVSGFVFEQDSVTGIAEATVTFTGIDEYDIGRSFSFTSNEDGSYSGNIYAGVYYVCATAPGYRNGRYSELVEIEFDSVMSGINIVMHEIFHPIGAVYAEEADSAVVKVYWSWTAPMNPVSEWLYYDDGIYSGSIGADGALYWGVSFPDLSDYAGTSLTKIAYYDAAWPGTITLNVYLGGTATPQTLVASRVFNVTGSGSMVEIELDTPVDLDGNLPLWITCYSSDISYPASASAYCGDPNSCWVSLDGTQWDHVTNYGYDYSWMLRGYVTDGRGVSLPLGTAQKAPSFKGKTAMGPVREMVAGKLHEVGTPGRNTITGKNRSFQYFKVYRTDCYNEDYSAENIRLLASELTDTVYMDVSWAEAEAGVYKWGVAACYEGNRESRIRWISTPEIEAENTNITGMDTQTFATTCRHAPKKEGDIHTLPLSDMFRGCKAYACNIYGGTVPTGWIRYGVDNLIAATCINPDLEVYGGDYCGDGYVYAVSMNENDSCILNKIDCVTGEVVSSLHTNLPKYQYLQDCAYDVTTGILYGTRGDGMLFAIDISTGSCSPIGSVGNIGRMQVLACDPNGNLYGISYGDPARLYAINKFTAQTTLIGDTGKAAFYIQSGGFDHNTGRLYWAGYDDSCGFFAEVDINTSRATVIANNTGEQLSWCIPFDNISGFQDPGESSLLWSNCIDKDMVASLDLTVLTNSGDSPAGAAVTLTNRSEPDMGYDYQVILDETGFYSWEDFRKGDYTLKIALDGFGTIRIDSLSIWENTSLEYVLEEIVYEVGNLHVSATGWAQWKERNIVSDWLHYDDDIFVDAVGANGGPVYWGVMFTSSELTGYDGCTLTEVALFDAAAGSYTLNIYQGGTDAPQTLVHTQTTTLTGADEWHHITLSEPVPFDISENLWITFYNIGSSFPASACQNTGDPNGRWISIDGTEWTDIASYGFDMTWMIRGLVSNDGRAGSIRFLPPFTGESTETAAFTSRNPDTPVTAKPFEGKTPRALQYYTVMLDGVFCAHTTDRFLQHDVAELQEGTAHTTSVAAVYGTGMSDWIDYEWIYRPCENYEGVEEVTGEAVNGNARITWRGLPSPDPGKTTDEGDWLHYDDGENLDAIGLQSGGGFYWAVMFPSGMLSQYEYHQLTKVAMFDYAAHTGSISLYQGGGNAPGTLVHTQGYVANGTGQYTEYPLETPIPLDVTKNLWIVMHNYDGQYVASCGANTGNPNGRWISIDGTEWIDMASAGLDYTWNLRAYVEEGDVPQPESGTLGVFVFRNGELLTPEPVTDSAYTDIAPEAGIHLYCIRVVYGNAEYGGADTAWYAMGCPQCVEVEIQTEGIGDISENDIRVFPNPTRGKLNIMAKGLKHVRVVNTIGQVMYDRNETTDGLELDMGGCPSGVYTVVITTNDGSSTHRVAFLR